MSTNGSTLDDDQVVELLAACDESLAAGQTLSSGGSGPLEVDRLHRGLACIQLLREVLANRAGDPATHTREQEPAEEPIGALPFKRLGRYEIHRELGKGSYGIVLLAHDPQLRREVAIKVPRAEALATSTLRERFLLEARAAAVLNHPNIW
jgi:eukaryotic-like serine/threonine-protein kinase